MGEAEELDPAVMAFMVKTMYHQFCDPKNPDNLLVKVNKLEQNHRIVLMFATGAGMILAFFKESIYKFMHWS